MGEKEKEKTTSKSSYPSQAVSHVVSTPDLDHSQYFHQSPAAEFVVAVAVVSLQVGVTVTVSGLAKSHPGDQHHHPSLLLHPRPAVEVL